MAFNELSSIPKSKVFDLLDVSEEYQSVCDEWRHAINERVNSAKCFVSELLDVVFVFPNAKRLTIFCKNREESENFQIECLLSLQKLKSVRIEGRNLNLVVSGLVELSNLRELELFGIELTTQDVGMLSKMTQLTSLSLSPLSGWNASFFSLDLLRVLTNLEALSLVHAHIHNITSFYLCLTNLKSLNLCRTGVDDNEVIRLVQSLTALRKLDLSHCEVGDEGIEALSVLTNLEVLILVNTLISRVDSLSSLKALHILDVSDNNITVSCLEKLTQVMDLRMDSVFFGDYTPNLQALSNLVNLRSLSVSYNDLGNEGAACIAVMTQLTYLRILDDTLHETGRANLMEKLKGCHVEMFVE